MANHHIISRLLDQCRKYEAGLITGTQLETSIEAHSQALEGITSRDVDKFRDFGFRFVQARFEDAEDVPARVSTEFRTWLSSLPGANAI